MEEGKKSFFELLDPKSALMVGLVGGMLSLGTLGFIVLGALTLNGSVGGGSGAVTVAQNIVPTQPAQPTEIDTTPPPVTKSAKPKVELFVMSYCPFGLQMQKALAPAWDLLKDKADISVKFVNYIMHGKEEIDENTRQFCIQKSQPAKYVEYMKCFVASGNATECGKQAGVSETQVSSCVNSSNTTYQITSDFNNQSTWLSGQFPMYRVHDQLNKDYGVQGSPTMVINGQQVNVARSPEAVKQAICAAFNTAPEECAQTLPNVMYQQGFGMQIASAAAGAAAPGCGT